MPSKIMDQRHISPSFFTEEMRFPVERQVGFWKPESLPDQRGADGFAYLLGGKSVSSSPLDKLQHIGVNGANMRDQQTKFSFEESFISRERAAASLSSASSWRAADMDSGPHSKLSASTVSLFASDVGRPNISGNRYENGLFSSSFSDILDKKMRMGSRSMLLGGPVVNLANRGTDHHTQGHTEEEPFELTDEIEAQTIGNLLPDDEDLLSGVIDEIACMNLSSGNTNGDDIDDDIFFPGGGMELEGDELELANGSKATLGGSLLNGAGPFVGEHPFGEHPSRTLFVRNINSNVEDSELRLLFEQYGDIRTLYTACKHRGFVMISYYDIRSARNAMRSLQNKPLRRRKLDIHYSIPKDNPSDKDVNQGTLVVFNLDSSISNDDLHQIFGVYGEIKEIRETPHKCNHKFIEYYDIRAAEAALRALNRSDIAGKKIKLEPSRPGGTRRLLPQLGSDIDQEEMTVCKHGSPGNSPSTVFGSISMENGGSIQGLPSSVRAQPVNPFVDSQFPSLSSSLSQTLSSPIGISSVGPHSVATSASNGTGNQSEISHSLGQMNFGFQGTVPVPAGFHPHSLPDHPHNNGMASNGLPYNINSMSAMGININTRTGEGIDGRHLQKVGSTAINGHSFDRNESGFGFSGSGSCPLHGNQQLVWNNSPGSFGHPHPHHQPSGPAPNVLWSNSVTSLLSNLPPAHHHHPIPRGPSHLLDSLPLPHHHHVGSAPSIWDRRQHFVGSTPDLSDSVSAAQSFHPGSLGSSQLHAFELAGAHGMGFSAVDPSLQVGMPSPQQRGAHMFHAGRNPPMVPIGSGSFDGTANERGMRARRSDSSAGQGDNRKQYELDVDKIMRGDDSRTTLMIKNIPNKYTSKMLLAAIDESHRGTYDFIYLPIDFKNKCNVGYAFINMINPQHIIPFYQTFNGKKWEKFNSEKVASLAYARIQGKSALIAHFQNSSLMNEDKRCRPILFHSEGPNAGDQEPFPMGSNIRSRSGRNRSSMSEENSLEATPIILINTPEASFTEPTSSPAKDSSE
ncbi:protein MEI2-like 4 isoform X2 [Carex littledalei]|uniref:Protein MEI2-like 4 isoform X2 n=1 Tax=Carex littledalei TaxID=544730 RepID=A0A833VI36_9POAL|nr:protein MEI2-like 4 isoform X2 [Carex littledalei]